jgi:hypothetical protein
MRSSTVSLVGPSVVNLPILKNHHDGFLASSEGFATLFYFLDLLIPSCILAVVVGGGRFRGFWSKSDKPTTPRTHTHTLTRTQVSNNSIFNRLQIPISRSLLIWSAKACYCVPVPLPVLLP